MATWIFEFSTQKLVNKRTFCNFITKCTLNYISVCTKDWILFRTCIRISTVGRMQAYSRARGHLQTKYFQHQIDNSVGWFSGRCWKHPSGCPTSKWLDQSRSHESLRLADLWNVPSVEVIPRRRNGPSCWLCDNDDDDYLLIMQIGGS